mmetsp:Transcript_34828/g.100279  ORF Transcript_34828/g.100279 Transcript_34828/m.100279 type:complete len:134 (+) Transcript_34828:4372-4773(+)
MRGEQRDVTRAAAHVQDEHIALARAHVGRLVEPVCGDGGSTVVAHDPHDVEAAHRGGVLHGLPLRMVEVPGDADDGVLDCRAEGCLGGILELGQHHGRHVLHQQTLGLVLVRHLDDGFAALGPHDLERPVLQG